jgi:hypothetical protein
LMFLDLKLGNICNLKCRICGSWSSSSTFATRRDHGHKIQAPGKKSSFHYAMLRAGAWPRRIRGSGDDLNNILIRYATSNLPVVNLS